MPLGLGADVHHEVFQPDLNGVAVEIPDLRVQAVEDLLPISPVADHVVHAQQPEMMRDRRLRQLELLA